MITIIHGNDIATSRKYFMNEKERFVNSLLIDGQKIDLTDLIQIFEGGELFVEQKNFFIEQLLSKRKKSKELDQILEYINKNGIENDIYIWEEKEITPASIKTLKNPVVKTFKLPQTLFLFLENIKPGNGKTPVRLFHETIENSDPEMVFFMIVRQIRTLLALHLGGVNGRTASEVSTISEVSRLAPWQKSKLQAQADFFEPVELIHIYNKLFEIEKGLKTGGLSANLTQTIDFLLLEI